MARQLTAIGCGFLCSALWAGHALAGDYQPVSVRVINHGARPVLCTAQLAHWYTSAILLVAQGSAGETTILSDPQSGTIYLLNGNHYPMPVEQIGCGQRGSWVTPVLLSRRIGQREHPIELVCGDSGCQRTTGG